MAGSEGRKGNLKLNISGTVFVVSSDMFRKHKETPLSSLTRESLYYDVTQDAYCFSRDPDVFYSVLNFFRYGELHLPKFLCGNMIKRELEFWGIAETYVSKCCSCLLHDEAGQAQASRTAHVSAKQNTPVGVTLSLTFREKIWLTLEDPDFSLFSKIWSHLYTCVLLLHACVFIIWNEEIVRVPAYLHNRQSAEKYGNEKLQRFLVMDPALGMICVAVLCNSFFTIVTTVHFYACSNRLRFIRSPRNCINICLQMITWFVLVVELSQDVALLGEPFTKFYTICTGLNVLRLVLIFKASGSTSTLNLLFITIKETWKELCALFFAFFVGVAIIGTLVYYSEMYHTHVYPTVFDSLWWATVSMTTVGYADAYPHSGLGKIIVILAIMYGVFVIILTTVVFAVKYMDNYHRRRP